MQQNTMNYNLARQVNPEIRHDLYEGMDYGRMPESLLTSKFEETDMGPDEDAYDNYARNTLTDWRPDQATFAHEAPRGGVNRSKGLLQLRSDGHRGNADVEHPELFLGFGGPEDWDPRGIATDPDMKKFTSQQQARMRFQYMSPDMSDHITGGMRNEFQVMQDLQKLIKIKRDRLKIFDRQLDGRREGLRRAHTPYKSNVSKQILVQSYGDLIRDYGLNPQRRAHIIAKSILRDTREYRDETTDQDFEFARYTQLCRRQVSKTTANRVLGAQGSADGDWKDADTTKCYRAVGLLMSNIVSGKRTAMQTQVDGDIDYSTSKVISARKTAPFVSDVAIILQSIAQESNFAKSDETKNGRNPAPRRAKHLARQLVFNHLTPAHHFLNAEILYKSVKPGADMQKIKSLVITDATNPDIRDEMTIGGRTAKMQMMQASRHAQENVAYDQDSTESVKTVNYKTVIAVNGDRRIRIYEAEQTPTESDNTQGRAMSHTQYRITGTNDVETNINFLDNATHDRLGGRMGTKYTQRHVDRDSRTDGITGGN